MIFGYILNVLNDRVMPAPPTHPHSRPKCGFEFPSRDQDITQVCVVMKKNVHDIKKAFWALLCDQSSLLWEDGRSDMFSLTAEAAFEESPIFPQSSIGPSSLSSCAGTLYQALGKRLCISGSGHLRIPRPHTGLGTGRALYFPAE